MSPNPFDRSFAIRFRDALTPIAEAKNDPVLWLRMGDLNRNCGDLDQAGECYRRALQHSMEPAPVPALLGRLSAAGLSHAGNAGAVPFSIAKNLLSIAEQFLIDQALQARVHNLVSAGLIGDTDETQYGADERQALRCDAPAEMIEILLPHVLKHLNAQDVVQQWGLPALAQQPNQVDVTCSGDQAFYGAHLDEPADRLPRRRMLSFVYYFFRQPRRFEGGDLLLFDTMEQPGVSQNFTRIVPQHNSLICFPSDRLHEIQRVRCPSASVLDGRVTVNGWFGPR